MKYCVRVVAIGAGNEFEITKDEFNEIKTAKKTLGSFYTITENYRVVLESYRSVEMAKFNAELDDTLYSFSGYETTSDVRVALASPIVGYLSAAKFFLDATDKVLSKVLTKAEFDEYKAFRSKIYDEKTGYAFIEALRNYVQHRDLALHRITYEGFLEDKNDMTSDIVKRISLRVIKTALEEDKKFKREILPRLEDQIDLIESIRTHLEGIWMLHKYIVEKHAVIPSTARDAISQRVQQFKAEFDQPTLGLHACHFDDENAEIESMPLLLSWDDVRIKEIQKLGNLTNLSRRYITGKTGK